MDNINANYTGDSILDTPQFNNSTKQGGSTNKHSASQQQKRQNSLSNYMTNNSNKRVTNSANINMNANFTSDPAFLSSKPNRLSAMGLNPGATTPGLSGFEQQQSSASIPLQGNQAILMSPRFTGPRSLSRRNVQIPLQQLHISLTKTPTPSSYDVPSSPNPNTNTSARNISDLPDSNPTLDHLSQGPLHSQQLKEPSILLATETTVHSTVPITNKPPQSREMTEEEQQLATKLKDTYKNIVNYEEIVQKNCLEISIKVSQFTNPSQNYTNSTGHNQGYTQQNTLIANNAKSSELSNELWNVYHNNISLLDNYTDFLVTALKPSSNEHKDHFKTGKNIVDLYKIPRRMWVYGVVAFLEVLKNIINIFQEHAICSSFISHCFSIIAYLTDPALDMEGWWSEKLGDLSRMAIALYNSRFIDWKVSAEYWYSLAMRTLYGHGKIYYHTCTVQQDNLDALVNIGKSVVCRDPFVPTQQYLRLVVENICTQRNILSILELPIIDFIKIHKVLLSINTIQLHNSQNIPTSTSNGDNSIENLHETQLQYGIDLVSRYGITFGSDSNGFNFFTRQLYSTGNVSSAVAGQNTPYYLQQQQPQPPSGLNSLEKLNFWLNKGPLFAIANINHIVGLGDSKNPFAKIFLLPEALKERKDKKDRKRKSKSSIGEDIPGASLTGNNAPSITASEISEFQWAYYLKDINKSVLELSVRIFKHYLVGPIEASYGHVIIWLYFLIAIGEATNKHPQSKPLFHWLLKHVIPWDSLINYLNTLLIMVKSNKFLNNNCRNYITKYPDYVQYLNQHETLSEVWKCWGTLWFDFISLKTDYCDFDTAGIADYNIFDLPVSGIPASLRAANNVDASKPRGSPNFDDNNLHHNNDRIVRVILLARFLADNYDFGLVRSYDGFKFWRDIIPQYSSFAPQEVDFLTNNFLYGDNRFMTHNFFDRPSDENTYEHDKRIAVEILDDKWFEVSKALDEEEGIGFDADDLMDEFNSSAMGLDNDGRDRELEEQVNKLYNQQHQVLQSNLTDEEYYNSNFMINPDDLSIMADRLQFDVADFDVIEGDLGEKIDTSLTYVTLDTNIWLKHCGRVFKCIRNGVFKILIPLIVFQELRSLRKSAEATIADAATRSVIIIRELYSTKELIPLRFDGTVATDINETTEFENNSNWRANIDETILNAVNQQNEIGKKMLKGLNTVVGGKVLDGKSARDFHYCILITDDRNMRLRAKTIGVTSFQSKWLFGQLEINFQHKCID